MKLGLFIASILLLGLGASPALGRIGDEAAEEESGPANDDGRQLGGGQEIGRGGVLECKYGGDSYKKARLEPGNYIERGQGICTRDYSFGITYGDGKLQLIESFKKGGHEVLWAAGPRGIHSCRMHKYGAFVCHNRKGKPVWALNCGGKYGSYMELDEKAHYYLLQKKRDKKSFKIDFHGKQSGSCKPKTHFY